MTATVFEQRYNQLNSQQQAAVDAIEGPLLVVAGPGTGKTELLSLRAANILDKTDTLAANILCLTFTESGSDAMRQRLTSIIGPDAYKVAIHTFHGFGSEIIGRYRDYFYHGAALEPADDLVRYEIIESILDSLDYKNPLASKHGEAYVYAGDIVSALSELKRSGLTSDELRNILDANRAVYEQLSRHITDIFSARISQKTTDALEPLIAEAASLEAVALPAGINPYSQVFASSLARAITEARESNSTKPITAWRDEWCRKNDQKQTILKDFKNAEKLDALAHVYGSYLEKMEQQEYYDYDDMILQVVHALETQPDLKAELQEKYQYIMIDEFQDTNLAQLRIALNLTEGVEQPNIMAVGDDDQAIFAFQGADIGNIRSFIQQYNPHVVVLTDNYRSSAPVLEASRDVITQGEGRLEDSFTDLSKQLNPRGDFVATNASLTAYQTPSAEYSGVAADIARKITSGVAPQSIAVIARRHSQLIELLPYLAKQHISVNYERRDDALAHEIIQMVENMLRVLDSLSRDAHDEANSLLPKILTHPAFDFSPSDLYQLSLASHRNHQDWLEVMQTMPVFKPLADWLLVRAAAAHLGSFEEHVDAILGLNQTDDASYISPLGEHFFGADRLQQHPDSYIEALEALRTVRDAVRDHYTSQAPTIRLALDYVDARRQIGAPLTIVRSQANQLARHINLLSSHKSKGLEFEHVYILGATDNQWGETVRSRSRLINYPANLPLAPSGNTYNDRLRLFYVAMTRAKTHLSISYSAQNQAEKTTSAAGFLAGSPLETIAAPTATTAELIEQLETDWRQTLAPETSSLKDLLQPALENYKLSATHLGNFLDISRGGPLHVLTTHLRRFPQAKQPSASYGTAIHELLQRTHDSFRASGTRRAIEDVLGDFRQILAKHHLDERDFEEYLQRGTEALSAFLGQKYDSFSTTQQTELGFGRQQVMVGPAHLTGALDLVDIDQTAKTIRVTDYKTGKPARDWKGSSAYEKMKLHRYRQQLMFYQLLVENSRDYSQLEFDGGVLQFVEPTQSGDILALEESFNTEELAAFRQLIDAVWRRIVTLDFPDISGYSPDIKGIKQFEADLIDTSNV